MKHRVVIAMSGGVDSSVVAALLKRDGYECIGMHLHFWTDPLIREGIAHGAQNKCCTLGGLEDARFVCEKLGIPFYVMNVEREFKERVVDYFLEGYRRGETPNPCVECNRYIKFGELLRRAEELGADFLASGHYAQIAKNAHGEFELLRPRDREKDQTYFLYTLTQEKLAKILFPLGNLLKSEVYELAQKFGLERVVEKPQSQGLCFFAEGNPKYFLMRYLPSSQLAPGEIRTKSGRVIGTHRGLPLYTKGQRSGLGIGGIKGEPEGEGWYVVDFDREHNALVVGREKDIEDFELRCSGINFVSGREPAGPLEIQVRIRHRGALTPAVLEMRSGTAVIKTKEPMRAPAGGQSAVFYQDEKLLGGGIIESDEAKKTARRPRQPKRSGVQAAY